jgi:putative DNA methylase
MLATLSELIPEIRERVKLDGLAAGVKDDDRSLEAGGRGATARADAIAIYLALLIDQVANHSASVCGWNSANTQMRSVFSRQAITVPWDFAESNPFCDSSGSYNNLFERHIKAFVTLGTGVPGFAEQADAVSQAGAIGKVVSTDPPYYDNIGYADLSDFFYVWLRHSLSSIVPGLFRTVTTPKASELVAVPYRHGSKEKAEAFFLDGMTRAMKRLAQQSHPAFPVTIYYAFKQAEGAADIGMASTGWETFLEAVIHAGFELCGTWPLRTEKEGRVRSNDSNALASSIVLVCRPLDATATIATRREFLDALKSELPAAIARLQHTNIAPVDLAQSAIGPGMGLYSRYSSVVDADGRALTVRDALTLINQTLDEILAEQDGGFEGETRWAVAWFEQHGFTEADYGSANLLATAKNTSVEGLAKAHLLISRGGKVKLLEPRALPPNWIPSNGGNFTAWEIIHYLIRTLETEGEVAAAKLMADLGARVETVRDLSYRLYAIAERNKWTREALSYNGLVQSWPEIVRLSRETPAAQPTQTDLLGAL